MKFKQASPRQIVKKCREIVAEDLKISHEQLPLYRLKLKGTLAKGYTQADVDVNAILEGFQDKALFSTMKKFETGEFSVRLDELRALHRSKVSLSRMGIDLLEKNLAQTPFAQRLDAKRLFELLEDKENLERTIQLLDAGELVKKEELKETVLIAKK
jgi:hypothetical protein